MMTETPTSNLINNFDKIFQSLSNGATPNWLAEIRATNLERFNKLGFPTTKDEEWKYTNISSIVDKSYSRGIKTKVAESDFLRRYINKADLNIVFINNEWDKNVNAVPKGVTIMPLEEAFKNKEDLIKKSFQRYPDTDNSFIALNQAISNDGVFIHASKNTTEQQLIHIIHLSIGNEEKVINMPRTIIHIESSAELTILESHISLDDRACYLANPLTDIFLEENAVLHYCKAQKDSLKAYHIGSTRVWQEQDSTFDGFSLIAGGGITRNNLDVILNGKGCDSTINGLYSVYGSQHVDNHSSVDHRQPNCTSNQLYKGILNGSSRAVFNGKIFVKPIAQLTNSYQLNKNLLLGTDCRVDTKPQLEIFADDVKCTHGATIGQLNEDELFYLQTRCITRKEAVKMLSKGFVNDLIYTIKNEGIISKLQILLEPSFAQL